MYYINGRYDTKNFANKCGRVRTLARQWLGHVPAPVLGVLHLVTSRSPSMTPRRRICSRRVGWKAQTSSNNFSLKTINLSSYSHPKAMCSTVSTSSSQKRQSRHSLGTSSGRHHNDLLGLSSSKPRTYTHLKSTL